MWFFFEPGGELAAREFPGERFVGRLGCGSRPEFVVHSCGGDGLCECPASAGSASSPWCPGDVRKRGGVLNMGSVADPCSGSTSHRLGVVGEYLDAGTPRSAPRNAGAKESRDSCAWAGGAGCCFPREGCMLLYWSSALLYRQRPLPPLVPRLRFFARCGCSSSDVRSSGDTRSASSLYRCHASQRRTRSSMTFCGGAGFPQRVE